KKIKFVNLVYNKRVALINFISQELIEKHMHEPFAHHQKEAYSI
ncbi:unnamed protein product, partial [Musa acuminata subsp. burmannicoides]